MSENLTDSPTFTETDKVRINELRERVRHEISPSYDTDFNLKRWLTAAEKTGKCQNVVDAAEANLRHHLRFRRSMHLDEQRSPDPDDNPMLIERYSSRGRMHYMPSRNKYMWWGEYGTFDTVGILHKVSTTDMLVYNFYFFEYALRVVSECEKRTGQMSGVYMIMDVKDHECNPWTLMFSGNGQLSNMIQLFGYEHYPEVVSPYYVINLPKWLYYPMKIIQTAMPKDFNDKCRFHDHRYKEALLKDIAVEDLPKQLGGQNPDSEKLQPTPPRKIDPSEYYQHKKDAQAHGPNTCHVTLHSRQRKCISLQCRAESVLSWFFTTDADIYFGVFCQAGNEEVERRGSLSATKKQVKCDILDTYEMVHPYFRLGAKLVPERGRLTCKQDGVYHFVFCNKHSWLYGRNVYIKIDSDDKPFDKETLISNINNI